MNLILRFAEDGAQHALFFAKRFGSGPLVLFERDTAQFQQARSIVSFRHDRRVIAGRPRVLLGYLEEQQKRELFDVIAGLIAQGLQYQSLLTRA